MLREPWRTRLLFISVAGNVFAAGLIGAHFTMRRPHPPGPPRAEAMVEHMARELPPEDAARFRAVMQPRLHEIDAARARTDQARAAMFRAMRQTPYDEAKVRQTMKDLQTSWVALSDGLNDSTLAALADLSPDGRRRLAEAGLRHHP
jgi:uncharacterized membrane protein